MEEPGAMGDVSLEVRAVDSHVVAWTLWSGQQPVLQNTGGCFVCGQHG